MIGNLVASDSLADFQGCTEWERLLRRFIATTGDLIAIQAQFPGSPSSDQALQQAVVEKVRAKLALVRHLRHHPSCGVPEWMAAGVTRYAGYVSAM